MFQDLKERVCRANLDLKIHGLVILSWGNVSEIDRKSGVIAIKPSGISYDDFRPDDVVLVDLDGKVIDGQLNPSSDTPTHLELYKNFPEIGGVCHTHSPYATMWAQAKMEIPCLGTTHGDHFFGRVPVTRELREEEILNNYERNTGKVIVERLTNLKTLENPAVLVACHGPFTWGETAKAAVIHALILEEVAKIALGTWALNPGSEDISKTLLNKHFLRKHGKNATYGQKK
ncbi:MAG: L-ribulose-5-phosphate 4-epimerase AraD [Candidatus Marinimicrobia bacterium]|nr:L-ribulose-5-phosphate 4-epimerase AraD [Candidatus Neomarinimicrobiota bacterium]